MKKTLSTLALAFCLNTNAQIISTVAGSGVRSYSGNGGQATSAAFNGVFDVAVDATGNLYIADAGDYCIRKVNTNGIVTTIAGNATQGYTGDNGPATLAKLQQPHNLTIDAIGNLYISDGGANIRKVNTAGIITTIAGVDTAGYTGDGGPATAASLNEPYALSVDAVGNLYFADGQNNCVRKINTAGVISTVAGGGTGGLGDGGQATAAKLSYPVCIAIDAVGNLYVGGTDARIRKINTSTGIISTVAGNGTSAFSGDSGPATAAELWSPEGLVVDAAGNLYISDSGNSRVRMVSTNGVISTIVGNGYNSTSGGDFSGDGGPATAAALSRPYGLAFNSNGDLYIADTDNYRVRKVTNVAATGIIKLVSNEEVNIYPNPNNGVFDIEVNAASKQTLQVYDVSGKIVLSQPINGKTNVNANSLPNGVYNISLISNEGVVNKRIIILK